MASALLLDGCVGDVLPGSLTAEAGPDLSIGLAQAAVLTGGADGGSGGYTFSWSPVMGLSNPNIAQPTVTGTAIGVQVYTLTVRDSAGNISTDTTRVETAQQPLLADAGPDLTGTVGDTILLQGFASGGIGNYIFQWTTVPVVSPALILGSTTLAPFFMPTDPGMYVFTLTVTDSEGFSDTDIAIVTISAATTPEVPGEGF